MYSVMNDNDIKVVEKAKSWMVKTWGDTTTTVERRAALLKMKKKIDHKEVSRTVFVACTKLTFEMSILHAAVDLNCHWLRFTWRVVVYLHSEVMLQVCLCKVRVFRYL